MYCSRRLYKGNSYEICLPLIDTGVTLVRFYTRGEVIIEKEPEISGDSMCFSFTEEDLASLEDGVLRYQLVTDYETTDTNAPFVVITPGDYSGSTLEDIIADAFDSGYTAGQEDCSGGTCEGVWEGGYTSGYTDGQNTCSGETCEGVFESGYSAGVQYQRSRLGADTFTQNATYLSPTAGWSSVTVDVPKILEYPAFNITENGTQGFSPSSGYDGFGHVKLYVSVPDRYNEGYYSGHTDGYEEGLVACSSVTEVDLIANLQGDYYQIPYSTQELREYAFYHTCFSSITIPSTVWAIRSYAFAENSCLTSITIPDSVLGVSSHAFRNCTNLQTVTLGRGLRFLNPETFRNCYSLTGITIPSGITGISANVFGSCSGLTEMTFEGLVPPALTNISGNSASLGSTAYTFPIYVPCESVEAYKTAFGEYYAPRITCAGPEPQSAATAITITVPQNLEPGDTGSTSVSTSPQDAPTNLSYSSSDNSVATVDNNGNITAVGTGTTNICVTDSISQITECAQLTISEPQPTGTSLLTNIYRTDDLNPSFSPTSAVQLCNENFFSAITEMKVDGVSVIPSMTADFSSDAGRGGLRYHTVEYTINTPIVPVSSFTDNTHLVHTVISGDCTEVGSCAFWRCENLGCDRSQGYSGIELSPNIVLSDSVFAYCTQLKEFEIPAATTVIPEGLLYVCSGLTSVTVHSGVTVISGRSFQQCDRLVSIELPAGLTEIGPSAFYLCRSLTEIKLLGTVPPTIHGSEVFTDTNNCPIYVPAGSVTAYQTAWSQYANRIQAIQ